MLDFAAWYKLLEQLASVWNSGSLANAHYYGPVNNVQYIKLEESLTMHA
jgi:hypothetical protein